MSKKSVLLLMSGGVDSSVAGALLQEQGYELVGITMKQLDVEPTREMSGGCCSFGDVRDAKRVAAKLGIPHYTVNTAREFHQKVIQPFIKSYEVGMTPNPCVRCNSFVRYEEAIEMAREQGCDYVATGHYAKIVLDEASKPHLYRATYCEKDQSYYLYGIRRELLEHIKFPLGDKTKDEVREIARALGLITADKPESQEICFTLGRSYKDFLAQHIQNRSGPIIDRQGNILGTHNGVTHYTVGQRKGLGLSGGPFYVCELDPKNNRVIVGSKEDLGIRYVEATSARWIQDPQIGQKVYGQIRSRHQPAPARIANVSNGTFAIEFDEPQYGVAPGQALVLSHEDEILGGGTILPSKKH